MDDTPQAGDLSSSIKYSDLVKRLEKIHNAKSLADRENILRRFIESFKKLRESVVTGEDPLPNEKASFYPILRLLLPAKDTERDSYGIKTKTLGNLFVKALAINKHSAAGQKLAGERANKDNAATSGDFGDVVYEVMRDRQLVETLTPLTVYDVNKCLDQISIKSTDIDSDLADAIRQMSALDCKWFTRIILKKLDLHIGFQRIMNLYHPRAFDCYNESSSLSSTCKIIESGNAIEGENSNQSHIELFRPIRPMLCERGKIAEINKLLDKDDYYLETKMDGERCHIHINGKDYKYFSRSCNDDSTKTFGADFSGGTFSPILHRLLGDKLESAILDGEMMVWNRDQKAFVSKTDKATARFLRSDDPHRNPCFCIYDLLYLNGKKLVNFPYAERIRNLRSLVTESPGQLVICTPVKIRNAEHFLECVNKAFDEKEEGVVIKRAESIYHPGKRDGGGWYKIKVDYEDNLITDFDLLIIGGYCKPKALDSGTKEVHKFLLGVHKKDSESESGKFYALCKVANRLTGQERERVLQKLEPYWQTVRPGSAAHRIEWNKAIPHVFIEPKHSIVLQIKASDLYATNTYRTSHTFRFPRVKAVRDDKPWFDCCSLNEFEKFCLSKSQTTDPRTMAKRHATIDDVDDSTTKPLSKKKRQNEMKAMASGLNNEVGLIDNVCADLDFCILNAGKYDEKELENMIRKHGGRVVKTQGPKTYACIADGKSYRVNMAITSEKYNIATADWLRASFGGDTPLQSLPPFQPLEMVYAKFDLQLQFRVKFDKHGDSYEGQVSKDDFRAFSSKMDVSLLPSYTKSELYELEKELWAPKEPPKFFRFLTAKFLPMQSNCEPDLSYELAQFLFTTKAGRIMKSSDANNDSLTKLTHIFINENHCDPAQVDSLRRSGEFAYAKVVSHKWILECCDANKKISDGRSIYNDI